MNTTKANRHLERALELVQSTGETAFGGTAFGMMPPGGGRSKQKKGPVKVLLKYTKDNKDALLNIAIDLAFDAGGIISDEGDIPIWHAEGHGNSPFFVQFHVTTNSQGKISWNAEVRRNNIPILQGATNIRVVVPGNVKGTHRNRQMGSLIESLKKVEINAKKQKHRNKIRFYG